ncbi:DDE-type integrase/transposase/recombinase [Variovorax sp. KK3]|uniref:DDE-type integrase/transposase/recombinase n=1 Tax=Variovorax sp. KK3 TaxID=1855728 RepID=UPI00097BB4C5|nr:DDE-type integrase/transposase/recombinase [Variovorax sp. KK3]
MPNALRDKQTCDIALSWIAPLIETFDVEANLARKRFKSEIQNRADELDMRFLTLWRLILRYYYFGRIKEGLTPLVPGPEPGTNKVVSTSEGQRDQNSVRHRRGRQPLLTGRRVTNTFVVDEEDVLEMVSATKRCTHGPTTLVAAHDDYMTTEFAKRYPEIYADYMSGLRVLPVTYAQFRRYMKAHIEFDEDIARNLPALAGNDPGHPSDTSGPGDIYEVDATGGRIALVTIDEYGNAILVGSPWIYIVVDRWSRYIVSIYVTLGSPSWEEVKYALLVAFTSRVSRFRFLGIEISDEVWPVGRVCSVMAHDRGSEFIGGCYLEAAVQDLRIESHTMPPFKPDCRAVIERLNLALKKRMASSRLPGVYADRPLDPPSRRHTKNAQNIAATSLRDIYSSLINIVIDHNNAPHKMLESDERMIQAGVPPTPQAAYLWGCRELTGARVSPLTEQDLMHRLYSVGTGSIAKERLKFEKRLYEPSDEKAIPLARSSTSNPRSVKVRFDKTFPEEAFVVSKTGAWSSWKMIETDRQQIRGVTIDEEKALETPGKLLKAEAEDRSRRRRYSQRKSIAPARQPPIHANKAETAVLRHDDTSEMKQGLTGRNSEPTINTTAHSAAATPSWKQLEDAERVAIISRTIERRAAAGGDEGAAS